ncbi:MAG: tetratricopeptide repeat protein [Vicinamibacterales bacterium]
MKCSTVPAFLVAVLMLVSAPGAAIAQDSRKLNRRDIEKLIAEADKLAASGKPADARQRLMPVLQQDPTNAPLALKLARICESLSDWECAGTAYQLAVSNLTGPEKADAHAGLAAIHLRRGRYPDAAENARAAIALNPSIAPAHLTLAASLVRQGSADSLPAAQKAVEVAPTNTEAHMALGEAFAIAGKPAEAEASFRKLLELAADNAEAHARIAELLLRKGDFDGAIASSDTALKLNKDLNRLYSVRGRAHSEKGHEDQAFEDLQRAVAVRPDDTAAHFVLGRMYQRRKNFDLAANHYKSAATGQGQVDEAHLGLADVLVAKRDFGAAREHVERVASGLPNSARAQYLLGVLRVQQGQFDAALKALERAVTLDPKLGMAHYESGRVLREHMKDPARAVASLEKAAALEPENPDVLSEYGVALFEVKQPDRALEMLQKAAATPGFSSPMGLTVLGLVLKDRQRFDEALTYLLKAVELAPKWWLPHWGAAWSYFGQIKKGCPCGEADNQRVQKLKAHFDAMTSLDGKDPGLQARVEALLKGLKIK